ncbi:2-amino-4-hydroxy-6-hydroxymethyldihydropteridine pyrophosphokinase [Roseivivax isoporae LMG 25204]|uniref:2-amino-4-hydroxy-6-hydroxymethyldihydropteridine pyrophosphokinase n=2 Tax=Roseivivax TaxID=93682 RepID=X7F4D7_9RHOB|nr:2-amino-4-hydroxy-6-hydroxymethyldihydropteridine pyrophosphokinase [Roseivivax isoporae LMG 25204]
MLIALGANLSSEAGPPAATFAAALAALAAEGLRLRRLSRFYHTPCFPAGYGPDYVNAAALLAPPDGVGPRAALAALHRVEDRFGRRRETRWGMRSLDLDLLAFGETVLPNSDVQADWRRLAPAAQVARAPDELILPHPRLQDRAFVLVPLADVAPDWVHPATGRRVIDMRDALPDAELGAVVPL